jgi:hypothetical protein
MTPEEIKRANRSCRDSGAIGQNPILLPIVREHTNPYSSILDFGAGKRAKHAELLREEGYNVTASEFGDNFVEGIHKADYDLIPYDIIYASNVINVQSSNPMLYDTLYRIEGCLEVGGLFFCNYPRQPRYMGDINHKDMLRILRTIFWAEILPRKYNGTIYKCSNTSF